MAVISLPPPCPGGVLKAATLNVTGPSGSDRVSNWMVPVVASGDTTPRAYTGRYPFAGSNSMFWIPLPATWIDTMPLIVAPSSGADVTAAVNEVVGAGEEEFPSVGAVVPSVDGGVVAGGLEGVVPGVVDEPVPVCVLPGVEGEPEPDEVEPVAAGGVVPVPVVDGEGLGLSAAVVSLPPPPPQATKRILRPRVGRRRCSLLEIRRAIAIDIH